MVGLPVAAAVEAVAALLARGGVDRARAAQRGEARFGAQPAWVVAGRDQERGGGPGADAGSGQEAGGGGRSASNGSCTSWEAGSTAADPRMVQSGPLTYRRSSPSCSPRTCRPRTAINAPAPDWTRRGARAGGTRSSALKAGISAARPTAPGSSGPPPTAGTRHRRRRRGPQYRPLAPGAVGNPQGRQAAGPRAARAGCRAPGRLPRNAPRHDHPARADGEAGSAAAAAGAISPPGMAAACSRLTSGA